MSVDPSAPYGPLVDTTMRIVTGNVWGRFGDWGERQAGIEDAEPAGGAGARARSPHRSHPLRLASGGRRRPSHPLRAARRRHPDAAHLSDHDGLVADLRD